MVLLACATGLAGCAGGGAALGWVFAAFLATAAGVAGCSSGGTKEACCVDGKISTCQCPANVACNYGQGWTDNGNGTCSSFLSGLDAGAAAQDDAGAGDASEGDVGGWWGQCCAEGRVDVCYCEPNTVCNFDLSCIEDR